MRLLLLFLPAFLLAQKPNDIYIQAKKLEESGNYKEAMLLYKKIAIQNIDTVQSKIKNPVTFKQNIKTKKVHKDIQTKQTIEQMEESAFNLLPYKENYFLPFSYDTKKRAGRDQIETKFQLSVKRPVSLEPLGFQKSVNFAYTQTSWWQLYKDSSPFRETNYKPEIFITTPYEEQNDFNLKRYTYGFLHESNGQGEPKSRSWNRLYLKGDFQFENLFVTPRVWYRIPESTEDDDNPDLESYLGYGDITLLYPYNKQIFKVKLRNNLRTKNKGFAQLDWSFPLFNSSNTFGYLQFSNGYGDSLIDYDQNINRIGFGITLSR